MEKKKNIPCVTVVYGDNDFNKLIESSNNPESW